MKKKSNGQEGLKSLLLRFKRLNLAILTIAVIVALLIPVLFFLKEPVERLLNASNNCLACHKPESAKYVHDPHKRGKCSKCHTRHINGGKSKLKSPIKKLCLSCHEPIDEEIKLHFAHIPAKEGRCLECHENHASDYKNILVREPDKLCVSCHRIAEELAMKDRHEPFERKQCLSCHVAHGSVFERGLRNNQKDLCVLCHIDIAESRAKSYGHLPFEDGRCTDCHGAHASNFSTQLLASRPGLCYDCHPEIEPFFRKASHHPSEEGVFTCSNCHDPHAESYRYLLAANGKNFCFICHGDKKSLFLTCAHNQILGVGGTGDCRSCHVVHGADYTALLPKDTVMVCFDCHQKIADKVHNHPVADGVIDPVANKKLTCSSTCHNPHGTGKNYMVTWYPDRLCLKCHPKEELP